MNAVLAKRIAWRRRNVPHHYVGVLITCDSGIRLVGREPTTGIEVALSIPFEQIEHVCASTARADELVGEPSVVLGLAEGDTVLLRDVGDGALGTADLVARLERVRARRPPTLRSAS